jgi:phi13 family phage major tail protein
MNANENKVSFGLKNVHYAKLTETTDPQTGAVTSSYAAPKAWPGGVDISLDPNGDPIIFAADNGAYYTISNNKGYEGDFNSARIPDDVRTDLLGEHKDDKGLIVETDKDEVDYFALLFEVDGDKRPNRYCFYKVSISQRPAVSGQTTDPSSDVEPSTATTQFRAIPSADTYNIDGKECHLVKSYTSAETDAEAYANFYTAVQMPTFTAGGEGGEG